MKHQYLSTTHIPLPLSLVAIFVVLFQTGCSLVGVRTTDEPSYSLLQSQDEFELREYETMVVAETLVDATFDDAGSIAFRRLFGYISGDNRSSTEIDMTAPVIAVDEDLSGGQKISMTAPVTGQETTLGWRFAFVLPSAYTLANAPAPNNPQVRLAQVPARKVAVVRYSGSWSEKAYQENLELLQQWMQQNRLEAASLPRVAGYDPPWTLPFLRRNEVLIDVSVNAPVTGDQES